jgi:hypothetical protein
MGPKCSPWARVSHSRTSSPSISMTYFRINLKSLSFVVCMSNSIETMFIAFGFHVCHYFDEVDVDSVLDLLKPLPSEIPGGEIVRDPGLGVLCDTASTLVENISPNKTEEESVAMFKLAMKDLNSVGLVGVHEAGVFPQYIKLYQK